MLDLEFLLTHFPDPIFPRTISTYLSHGRQFEVFNKEEVTKAYRQSNYVDCRINAFPSYTEYKGIQRYPPNFIFADLDLSFFSDGPALERVLNETLRNIRIKIDGHPSVSYTGNGYHIYQPIAALILEQYPDFEEFEYPSAKFLRFAEQYLTNKKSDPSHNPSFKSCMIRVPGSVNSKCPDGSNEVRIIQKWDGYRPPMNFLLSKFHAYLVNEKINKIKLQERINNENYSEGHQTNKIRWIEILMQTPIEDYRKIAIALILSPYLINIKSLPYDKAFEVIKNWLNKCDGLRSLDENFDYKIKYSLNAAISNRRLPMKFSTLETKNKDLHNLLKMKI